MQFTVSSRIANGGAGVTIYGVDAAEGRIVIAAMQSLHVGQSYDINLKPTPHLFNGHSVDYMAAA